MPNGRRVIYIKNPSAGSNFRTLGGGGGTGSRTPRTSSKRQTTLSSILGNLGAGQRLAGESDTQYAKRVKKGKGIPSQSGPVSLTGGALYQSPGSNWFVNEQDDQQPFYGNLPTYQVGPYNTEFTPDFVPATTPLGALYDIFVREIYPDTGEIMAPKGTPGTLTQIASTPEYNIAQEHFDAGYGDRTKNPSFMGGDSHLPSYYMNLSPKRHEPRPKWLQWYERIQGQQVKINPYWFLRGGSELVE